MSKGGTTTSTSNAAPWSAQQPYLQGLFGGAQNAYNLYGANPASSVAGFTAPQQQSFADTSAIANGSNPVGNTAGVNNAAAGYTQSLLNGGGLYANPANPQLAGIATGQSPIDSTFASYASGAQTNPYLANAAQALTDPIVRAYQTATAPDTASQFAAANRYGSGAMDNAVNQNQQNLTQQLGNVLSPFLSQGLQAQQQNQLAGASGLSQNTLGALQQLGGNYNTAAQQQLAGSLNAPQISNLGWQTIGQLQNSGAQQQTLNQSQLNAPFNLLQQYGGLISGNYGTQGSSTQPYFTNPAAGALGGAAAGSTFGPWGAAAGGILGALSDRRFKTDVRRVGKLDNGLPVYSYRYTFGGPTHIGVMADEAKQVKPHAVMNVGGVDYVNYGAL